MSVGNKIKYIIFDLDGLLIDSEPLWRESEITEFQNVGVTLTEDDCLETKGVRIDEVVKYWATKRPWNFYKHSVANVTRNIILAMINNICAKGRPLKGVIQTIQFLVNHNIPLAIASSSCIDIINAALKTLELDQYFPLRFSAENEIRGKPDPAIYLTTVANIKMKPSECLAVEDSINGVKSAKSAGLYCIAIPSSEEYNRSEFDISDEKYREMSPAIFKNFLKNLKY